MSTSHGGGRPSLLGWEAVSLSPRLGVLVLVVGLVLVAACSAPPKAAPQLPTASHEVANDSAGPPAGGARTAAGAPLIDPSGASCAPLACVYHGGAGGYFSCLAGGQGSCFHFGAPCQPADDCMLDPSERSFRRCLELVAGVCQRFAAACAPRGSCWYRADEAQYRECLEKTPGRCGKWGALCDPTAAK